MKSFSILLLSFLWFNFASAQMHEDQNLIGQSFKNVNYKVSQNKEALFLDVFLPWKKTKDEKFPVLVIIHGGAWVEGDKSLEKPYFMSKLLEEALKNQFAVVSINYSLLGKEVHFPDPVLDCKDAVRWIRANAETYDFDSENIGLWGASAGAHLAMLIGYSDDEKWTDDENLESYSSNVNYIVDNFGSADLNTLLKTDAGFFTVFFFKTFLRKLYDIRNKLILAMTGTSLEADENQVKETLKTYSPSDYFNANSIPTLIFHGIKDKVVPIKESKTLHKKLEELNVENELVEVKGGDHGFNEISQEEVDQIVAKTIQFMKSQLK